jgi:hypothetical protein
VGVGGAQIGGQVAQRHVALVPDAAHQRQARAGHRTHQGRVVEGPQVLQRAATAHQQQRVELVAGVGQRQRGAQLRGRLQPLHQAGHHDQLHLRSAARQGGRHIAQRRRAQRGDDADPARKIRQRPLARGVEQALGLQLRLEAQELLVERTLAGGLQGFGNELKLTARLVERDAATAAHALPVLRREAQLRGAAAKQRAAQECALAVGILQAEVAVTAGGARETGDLALDADVAETPGELRRELLKQGRDAQGGAGTRGDKHGAGSAAGLAIIAADFEGETDCSPSYKPLDGRSGRCWPARCSHWR